MLQLFLLGLHLKDHNKEFSFPNMEALEIQELKEFTESHRKNLLKVLRTRASSTSAHNIKYLRIPRALVGRDKCFQEQLEQYVSSLVLTEKYVYLPISSYLFQTAQLDDIGKARMNSNKDIMRDRKKLGDFRMVFWHIFSTERARGRGRIFRHLKAHLGHKR